MPETASSQSIPPVPVPAALRALTSQAEGLWQALSPLWPDFSVEVLPSIDSTNSELMRRARDGSLAPTLLVALEQTAGRGRRGRSWVGQPGAALTFSLGLPLQPVDWSGLSLAVGVSLAESLHPEVRLKWPNDLWWQGRKLGGILVETASAGGQRHVVVGVGLNLQTPVLPLPATGPTEDGVADVLPPPVPPVGLQALGGPAAGRDLGEWLAAVLPPLARDLRDFERQGFAPFASRFAARDALLGLSLQLSDGRIGVGAGVGPDGALRLQTGQGLAEVTSAEVSVRPC
jgi:BirA family transcriptional regulator, biotin operon repressor / biotin---[acetyl-CoA-carboxylase] ligase